MANRRRGKYLNRAWLILVHCLTHCWYVILNSPLTTKGTKFTKVREGIAMLFPNFVCFVVKNDERTSTSCVEQ